MTEFTPGQIAYREFLQSDFWKELSAKKKFGVRLCHDCQQPSASFQCHHINYPLDWYQTTLEDLVVVCAGCHERRHGKEPEVEVRQQIENRRRRRDEKYARQKPWKPSKRSNPGWRKGRGKMPDQLKRFLKKQSQPKQRGNFLHHNDGRITFSPQ